MLFNLMLSKDILPLMFLFLIISLQLRSCMFTELVLLFHKFIGSIWLG